MSNSPRVGVYPGTFDPITNGHLDIIQRAIPIFDKVIVTLALNSSKTPLFSVSERVEMISDAIKEFPTVEVTTFEGLIVDFAKMVGATAIIRGLRAVSDFEYEFQMALMNRKQYPKIDTVYLMPDEKYTYLSSSIVREVAKHDGNVLCFVPLKVKAKLQEKFRNKKTLQKITD